MLLICSITVIAEPIAEQEDIVSVQIEDDVSEDDISDKSEENFSPWERNILIGLGGIFILWSLGVIGAIGRGWRRRKPQQPKQDDNNYEYYP